jgi:hypothetical protein
LLRAVDRRLGLLKAVDNILPDSRDSRYIEHSQLSLLRQRTYGLCLGYEDLNDHTELRQPRHYFCESLFWASQPKQAAKITRQLMPPAPRFVLRSCHYVTSLQARCRLRNTTSNDLTAFRM